MSLDLCSRVRTNRWPALCINLAHLFATTITSSRENERHHQMAIKSEVAFSFRCADQTRTTHTHTQTFQVITGTPFEQQCALRKLHYNHFVCMFASTERC